MLPRMAQRQREYRYSRGQQYRCEGREHKNVGRDVAKGTARNQRRAQSVDGVCERDSARDLLQRKDLHDLYFSLTAASPQLSTATATM